AVKRRRSGPGARLRRSSLVFQARDRKSERRSKTRCADSGDDGKGSGAAAQRRGAAALGARYRSVRGDARIRRRGAVAEVRDRSALQSPRQEVSVNEQGGQSQRVA